MSFEINSEPDYIEFLDVIKRVREPYFSEVHGKITVVTRERFNKLNEDQQKAIYEKLESVIKNYKGSTPEEHSKTLNKILFLRNELFHYLNPTSPDFDTHFGKLPNDVIGIIQSFTSPEDIRNLKEVNKEYYQKAIHKAQILSINNSKLRLIDALPPFCKTVEQAINWIIKDTVACKSLTYADFRGFKYFSKANLNKLIECCPNINHLFIRSDRIYKLEKLPESLTTLDCSGCNALQSLPEKLPESLTTLNCIWCDALQSLPEKLPQSLINLNCSWCDALQSLPEKLPESLTTLNCSYCVVLQSLPEKLPESLTTLDCSGCYALQSLPKKLPESLTTLDCSWCIKLKFLPKKLPESLTTLDCRCCNDLSQDFTVPKGCRIRK